MNLAGGDNGLMKIVVTGGLLLAAILAFRSTDGLRALVALATTGILYFLTVSSPAVGISGMIAYLAIIGGARRWLMPLVGYAAMDPLLLVNAGVVGLFFATLLVKKQLPHDTRSARLVLWLLGIMALQIVNPLQGSIAVGVAGCLFYMVPLLWFYVGRLYGTRPVQRSVLGVIVGVGMLAALYGLYQQWFGFSAGEIEWLKMTNMGMGMGITSSTLRVFSFFTSFAEYVAFVCIAAITCWAAFLRGNRFALVLFLFLLSAIFLSSSRGGVVNTLFGIVLLWAIQGGTVRVWLPRLVLATVIGVAGLFWSLQAIETASFGGPAEDLLGHQTQLLDPFSKASTGDDHAALLGLGIMSGFKNPLGQGLGATTLASGKFGGSNVGTEVDISNLFTSLGAIGGIIYLLLMISTARTAVKQWLLLRDFPSLAVIGILAVTLGQWLNGGHYAAAMTVWFLIGGLEWQQRKLIEQGRLAPETKQGRRAVFNRSGLSGRRPVRANDSLTPDPSAP